MKELDVAVLASELVRQGSYYPEGAYYCTKHIYRLFHDNVNNVDILTLTVLNHHNLYIRIKGMNDEHPLLLHGHVDTVNPYYWSHSEDENIGSPYLGDDGKGNIRGVGAFDMKGGVAMMVAALYNVATTQILPSDVILCLTADEEEDSNYGSRWLVEKHPTLFKGVKYAISEMGGYPVYVGSHKRYTVAVKEKFPVMIWLDIDIKVAHTTFPDAYKRLIDFLIVLNAINREALYKVTTDYNISNYSDLAHLLYRESNRNTCSLTVIEGFDDPNKIPSHVRIGLNCALIPGSDPGHYAAWLMHRINSDTVKCEAVCREVLPNTESDLTLLPLLEKALQSQEEDASVIPYMLPGFTDAAVYSKLGIQTYGFLPMNLPKDYNVWDNLHSDGEYVPIECLRFGEAVLKDVIRNYK